jgi:hypothetical protein
MVVACVCFAGLIYKEMLVKAKRHAAKDFHNGGHQAQKVTYAIKETDPLPKHRDP